MHDDSSSLMELRSDDEVPKGLGYHHENDCRMLAAGAIPVKRVRDNAIFLRNCGNSTLMEGAR
jgi:hypothetical protein